MKILNAALGLGCVLAIALGARTAEATSPKGKSFHVTVYTSFGVSVRPGPPCAGVVTWEDRRSA